MTDERMAPLRDEDISKIANAVAEKTKHAFHIEEEGHYNSHKRLDKLLDAYDVATSVFVKIFLSMIIVGLIVLAGFTAIKGVK